MSETILIVDDEDGVRRTFAEWLAASRLDITVFAAADAEEALLLANDHPIDLAVLDWNLGSGTDGLRLLEDLVEFQPDVVAILVTGFANQATPLDALRMGVRDYLDKNQNLSRETFLAAVTRQLVRIGPAKRERELNRSLGAFREAVDKILPLVRSAGTLNNPVPLPVAVHSLLLFLIRATGAADGVLLARHVGPDGEERTYVFGADGKPQPTPDVPFARSLAATVASLGEPCLMAPVDPSGIGAVDLMPFEAGRRSLLAGPIRVAPGTLVVIELFDKVGAGDGFSPDDRRLMASAGDIGAELLRQAMAERQTQRLLFDAVESALRATDGVARALSPPRPGDGPAAPPPDAVLDQLRAGLGADANAVGDADTSLKLMEAVRVLAVRHGPAAVAHCLRVVDGVRELLDAATGAE